MTLFVRFWRVALTAPFRPRVGVLEETSVFLRVWPSDLDVLWHMNNGRYCSLMDLGRTDLLVRARVVREGIRHGWYPVIASETIRFRQSLTLFTRFELRSRLIGWDDRTLYMQHTFLRDKQLIARALVRLRFRTRDGALVDAPDVIAAVDPTLQSPPLPEYVHLWQESDDHFAAELRSTID